MELQEGNILKHGEYTILKKLGQGGFGITYLASAKIEKAGNLKSMMVEADVVIKEFFLKEYCLRDEVNSVIVTSKENESLVERYREKFEQEAMKLSQMNHPNIVDVNDVIVNENGTVYYVMKYLEGGTLYKLVRPDEKTITPLAEEKAVRYIKQIANALNYMHQRKMCHYDVKPSNIMLDKNDNAVLIDFGLAKNYTKQGEQTSTLLGGATIGYAPLEQANANLETFSPQTDIYALGATLYFLLTGHAPKAAAFNLSEVLPKGQCGISDNLWEIIKWSMQANPENRPQNIESLLCLLQGNRTLYKLVCTDNEIKPLSEEAAVSYIKQIVKLLSLLSEREMLHFDVNPKKILLNEDKNIVSLSEGAQQETFSPQKGIYSLGATLYFLLTGRSPIISASNFSGVFPEGQCDISDSLWRVIQRCMHENPSNRPKDLDTFLRYLDGKEKEEPEGGVETDVITNNSDKSNSFTKKMLLFLSLLLGSIGSYFLLAELSKRNKEMAHIVIPNTQTFQIERVILPDTILLPEYFSAAAFSEGLAKVSYGGDCGYIDTLGQLKIPFLFNDAWSFSEGLAAAKSKNDKWGYINKEGKSVIPFIYDCAFPFEGGYAIVELDGKRGIIKKDGKFVIKPNNKHVYISNGCILTGTNGKWSCFDKIGDLLFDLNGYEEIGFMNNDMLPVKKDILHRKISDYLIETDYKWGAVDKWGKVRIDFIYDDIYSFCENRAVVKKGKKYGYIDRDGNIIVSPFFDYAYSYEDGMAKVKKGDKYGYVNLQGDLVIDTIYSNAYGFRGGLAKVKMSGKWGVVNKKGEEVIPFYYDEVEEGSIEGNSYRDITAFYSGLLPVKLGEKWGFINQKGETIIDFNYDEVLSNSFEGYSIVLKGNKFFVINLSMYADADILSMSISK